MRAHDRGADNLIGTLRKSHGSARLHVSHMTTLACAQ